MSCASAPMSSTRRTRKGFTVTRPLSSVSALLRISKLLVHRHPLKSEVPKVKKKVAPWIRRGIRPKCCRHACEYALHCRESDPRAPSNSSMRWSRWKTQQLVRILAPSPTPLSRTQITDCGLRGFDDLDGCLLHTGACTSRRPTTDCEYDSHQAGVALDRRAAHQFATDSRDPRPPRAAFGGRLLPRSRTSALRRILTRCRPIWAR